uniref:Uncharacterized protein n=1 Tax=Romanomermis culicivorax TaxID=13658 RepID=A0A915IJE2_ROMCU
MPKRISESTVDEPLNKIAKPANNFWQNALLQTMKDKRAIPKFSSEMNSQLCDFERVIENV